MKNYLDRYFVLEQRIENLERIKSCIYFNETQKIIRVNKLLSITKRKYRILSLITKMN